MRGRLGGLAVSGFAPFVGNRIEKVAHELYQHGNSKQTDKGRHLRLKAVQKNVGSQLNGHKGSPLNSPLPYDLYTRAGPNPASPRLDHR